MQFLTMPPYPTSGRFTSAFLAEVERETAWIAIESKRTIPSELWQKVGVREIPCPLCHGNETAPILCRGELTSVEMYRYRECDCRFLTRFWNHWREVPSRFAAASLDAIQPNANIARAISENRQGGIISAVQKHPGDSYLFIGAPGTGKTHLLYAMYHHALVNSVRQQIARNDIRQSTWLVNANSLMAEHAAWAIEKNKDIPYYSLEPNVTVRKISLAVRNGYRPRLFMDELDKFVVTDFKKTELCTIVDAVYAAEGQVVATSNKAADELAGMWGSDEAGTVLRRIGTGNSAHMVKFA